MKTVNVRLWGASRPAYAAAHVHSDGSRQVYAWDDVAGHYVSVEHLLTAGQVRHVVSRTVRA